MAVLRVDQVRQAAPLKNGPEEAIWRNEKHGMPKFLANPRAKQNCSCKARTISEAARPVNDRECGEAK
jgi:hypothetical protein